MNGDFKWLKFREFVRDGLDVARRCPFRAHKIVSIAECLL